MRRRQLTYDVDAYRRCCRSAPFAWMF